MVVLHTLASQIALFTCDWWTECDADTGVLVNDDIKCVLILWAGTLTTPDRPSQFVQCVCVLCVCGLIVNLRE